MPSETSATTKKRFFIVDIDTIDTIRFGVSLACVLELYHVRSVTRDSSLRVPVGRFFFFFCEKREITYDVYASYAIPCRVRAISKPCHAKGRR